MKMYVDGTMIAQTGYTHGSVANLYDLTIGKYAPENTGYIDGTIDEVRIRNRALSSGEVTMAYKSNFNKYTDTDWLFTTSDSG